MKSTKRIFALVLALVLLLTPMVSVNAAEAESEDILYWFDLETFLEKQPSSQLKYDYLKLATALQGLVNRDKPRLYFKFYNTGVAENLGYDVYDFWLENITDKESGYGELADGGMKTERKMNAGEYIAAFTKGEGGNYVYEIAIPWKVLGNFRPAYGKTVGLTVLAIDGDDGLVGGGRQIMWAGEGDDQSTWANATFK